MKAFSYRAYSDNGRLKRGTIIAETEARAAEQLKAQGLFAEEIIAKAGSGIGWRAGAKRARLGDDMRMVFTRQMAVLLAADLPSEAALEALLGSAGHAKLESFAAEARASVLEGEPLSDALAAADPGLPAYYIAAVRAGETSGELDRVFEELAKYLETLQSDKAQMTTALIYPAFVAAVSLLVCGILMTNVAPEIVAMFEVTGRPLPPLTEFMLGISDWITANWIALVVAVAAVLIGFAVALRQPAVRDRWHGMLLRLPVVGRLLRLSTAAQYLRTLALIIASRQTLLDAARNAGEVITITRYRDQSDRVCEAIQAGESLSNALTHLEVIPSVARQLLSAGEASARLAVMSERSATLVENWLENDRKRYAALLDPILMMVVGAMVLVIVLSVLLPIFDLQTVVGQ